MNPEEGSLEWSGPEEEGEGCEWEGLISESL